MPNPRTDLRVQRLRAWLTEGQYDARYVPVVPSRPMMWIMETVERLGLRLLCRTHGHEPIRPDTSDDQDDYRPQCCRQALPAEPVTAP